jgi:eukaryotic-like serine/threonine-protein kinase
MFVPPIAAIGGRPWCGRFAMTAQVIERDRLGALTKIGQGGQGVVYGAPNVKTKFADSMVYKAYKAPTRAEIDFGALAAMPALWRIR